MVFITRLLFFIMASFTLLQGGLLRESLIDTEESARLLHFSRDISITSNIAYGAHPKQTFDIYAPKRATLAPVIFMVHGGAWKVGDKTSKSVVYNKVNHWVQKGYIVISVNYRLLPEASVLEQVSDIRLALIIARSYVQSYGGDKDKFILMGHSAGAHLISLVAAQPDVHILGAISLDSAALNVEAIMRSKHMHLYDDAFGKESTYWQLLSPYHHLVQGLKPYLLICSTKREDSCTQANDFAQKAKNVGIIATVLPQDLTHKQINETLGLGGKYTEAVDDFIKTLFIQPEH